MSFSNSITCAFFIGCGNGVVINCNNLLCDIVLISTEFFCNVNLYDKTQSHSQRYEESYVIHLKHATFR